MKFPKSIALSLTYNDHKIVYETAAQHINDNPDYYSDAWVSEEQRLKAIATNELWTLHWYPNTPVGFNVLHSAELDPLLDKVEAIMNEQQDSTYGQKGKQNETAEKAT